MMISRRSFLLTAAAVSAAAAGAYVARPNLVKLIRPELDVAYPRGVLEDAEMRSIIALGETLAPPEFAPSDSFFRKHVDVVTQSQPGLLREYRRAAALLNTKTAQAYGKDTLFQALAPAERDKVLETVLWRFDASDRILRKLEKLAASRDALALRIYIAGPLIEHYYRSSYGWAVVGYESYPGRPPLDPRAYTKPLGNTDGAQ